MSEHDDKQGFANLVLHFPKDLVAMPMLSDLSHKFAVSFNIHLARITPREEGLMVLQLGGKNGSLDDAVSWLESNGVLVSQVRDRVKRDLDSCTHCGACTSVCPTGALSIDRKSMEVDFDPEECAGCGECEMSCPMRVMTVDLKIRR